MMCPRTLLSRSALAGLSLSARGRRVVPGLCKQKSTLSVAGSAASRVSVRNWGGTYLSYVGLREMMHPLQGDMLISNYVTRASLSNGSKRNNAGKQRITSDDPVPASDNHDDGNHSNLHIPVMVDEVLSHFSTKEGQVILDMTFGAGGHSKAFLEHLPGSRVIALDRDPLAHKLAVELSAQWPGRVTPLLGRFSDLPKLLSQEGVSPGTLDGALFDLGPSSMQFDQSERGFSISKNGPLDMRMDAGRLPDQPSAADIVSRLSRRDLYAIIKKYGEESMAGPIANAIMESRAVFGNITTTHQLADIIASVFVGRMGFYKQDKLKRPAHVATKTFQALRLFVNNELNELNAGLHIVHRYLSKGAVCVAISFHSLEDRIVKRHFHDIDIDSPKNVSMHARKRIDMATRSQEELRELLEKDWVPVRKTVQEPSQEEVSRNPRSRSAKLRAALKTRD